MNKAIFIFVTIIYSMTFSDCCAQNLVPNYSFEAYDSCPSTQLIINYASPWTQPTLGSSDYFNICATSAMNSSGIPVNFGGYQIPKDGNAYAGIGLYADGAPWDDTTQYNYREYIQVKLTDTLEANKCYRLKLFLSLGNFLDYYKTGNFGAYFSNTAISTTTYSVLNYVPQINYYDPLGIGDTISWYKIEELFLATGGEEYMTLGNFNNDSTTTSIIHNTSCISGGWSYYFIDSVSLIEVVCPIDIGINENTNLNLRLFPNPVAEKLTIQLDKHENTSVSIYNMFGENVLTTKLNSRSTEIDISFLDNGVYIVSLENETVAKRQKIIKNAH